MPGGGSECGIKVYCRFRPLNESEERSGSPNIAKFPDNAPDSVFVGGKLYTFDKVFQPGTSQQEIYLNSAYPVVKDVLSGYNGTIFAYGQTSSGKTFTMEGILDHSNYQGIVPRLVADIFNHIYTMQENVEFLIKVSFFEIYMDKIRDLLDVTKTNLTVNEDKNRVPFVKGCSERFVTSPEEIIETINEGKANRHVAVTNMNEHSSRSHSVFLITIKQEHSETQKKLLGNLYLVDLAGSEKVSKTGAEGTVLDEAKNINKSLSALGNVISALAEGTKSHVPYRDSKLTRILQQSLGGNARTTIIICCSPAAFNESETKSTLMFGCRAKTIKNLVQINEELSAEEWKRRYEKEHEKVLLLRAKLNSAEKELERWRKGETVPDYEWFSDTDSTIAESATESMLDESSLAFGLGSSLILQDDVNRAKNAESADYGKLLDEKDEEIRTQTAIIERFNRQTQEQEQLLKHSKNDYDLLRLEMERLHRENEASKIEVLEVLGALEELAHGYDHKIEEASLRAQENKNLYDQLNQSSNMLNETQLQLKHTKEMSMKHEQRFKSMLTNILHDLSDFNSQIFNGKMEELEMLKLDEEKFDQIDEAFTIARVFLTKMKSEMKNLAQKCDNLSDLQHESSVRLAKSEQEFEKYQLSIQQYEMQIKFLHEKTVELEMKQRKSDDTIDSLNKQLNELSSLQNRSNPDGAAAVLTNNSKNDPQWTQKVDFIQQQQFQSLNKSHAKQISELRDELANKNRSIDQLNILVEELKLENHQTKSDLERLKHDNYLKDKQIIELSSLCDQHEHEKQYLRGLQDSVVNELQALHNVKKLVQMQNSQENGGGGGNKFSSSPIDNVCGTPRSPPSPKAPLADIDECSCSHQQQKYPAAPVKPRKLSFIEENYDQLTKVHKQLVNDNADLRYELPKLEKRLRLTMDRVKSLESSLKEAKEVATRDRKNLLMDSLLRGVHPGLKRYQHEVDKIKEAVRQRNLAKRGLPMAHIVKPIRSGHFPTLTMQFSGTTTGTSTAAAAYSNVTSTAGPADNDDNDNNNISSTADYSSSTSNSNNSMNSPSSIVSVSPPDKFSDK